MSRIADALSWLVGHLLALALLPVIWQARRRIDRRRHA